MCENRVKQSDHLHSLKGFKAVNGNGAADAPLKLGGVGYSSSVACSTGGI